MNWKRIAKYSLALWFAGFAVGFVQGLFAPQELAAAARYELIGNVAGFALYLAVFAHMAAGADGHPIAETVAAMAATTALSWLCSWALQALAPQIFDGAIGVLQVAVELALMAMAATFGMGLGSYLRDRRRLRSV
ncbi:hypothetical protein [Lysobacter enzymogenes]|uniref:hypothetical protein n=1 Tax=Lysobacter enzymogenes TaxID=69 RepID=UPI00089BB2D9|nr:hypothetical protein [Lysobacter enzymogenes]SDX01289.1 hypothetical protein SAMN05421681_103485 [Lysobacter enzymogenes]